MPQTPELTRLAAAGALAVFLVGLGYAIVSGLGDGDKAPVVAAPAPVTTSTTAKPAVTRPKAAPFVKLSAAGAFDPEGDGRERDEEAPLAVDGRPDTFWRTERYARFFKSGVGLVVDAGRRVRVEQVVVDTPTPGIRAEIRLGASREGPFARVSPDRKLTARTRFTVAKRPGRYVVVWITELPPESAGEISEVRVRGRG
jgi:hypothetical protein